MGKRVGVGEGSEGDGKGGEFKCELECTNDCVCAVETV